MLYFISIDFEVTVSEDERFCQDIQGIIRPQPSAYLKDVGG